jgi:hypothetical protein
MAKRTKVPAPEVDNAGTDGGDYRDNVPYETDPFTPSPDWSPNYGHSDDVKVVDLAKDYADLYRVDNVNSPGFESVDRVSDYEGAEDGNEAGSQRGDSFGDQAIPSTNAFDRGAGSASRAKEMAGLGEGRGFDGTGFEGEGESNPYTRGPGYGGTGE